MTSEEIPEEEFSSDEDFDENDDSESSTDVDAKLAEDDVFDIEFLKCYAALKKKDEKIYDSSTKFFNEDDTTSSNDEDVADVSGKMQEKKSKAPKMTLLDHQLALAENDIEDPELDVNAKIDLNKEISKSFYEQELEEIKKSIEKQSENIDSDSDDDLLVVKGSSEGPSHVQSKPRKKINALLDKIENYDDSEIAHLKELWNNPNQLTEEDKFLRDYILNKRYLPSGSTGFEEEGAKSFFSKDIDELSDVETEDVTVDKKLRHVDHRSEEKEFDVLARVPRNSTKTIRDLVEKQHKKEKRLKKVAKEKKKKNLLKEADCEDIIDDLPTKFHYRETEPNDYGLSAEELLMATDEELEQWAKLHKTIAYKTPEQEAAEKRKYQRMKDDIELKRKIFKSIYSDEAEEGGEKDPVKPASKKGKRRKTTSESSLQEELDVTEKCPDKMEPQNNKPGKRKKKHKRGLNHKKFAKTGVAPDRLLAYGLSKTKLKKSKLL